jgi:cyclophilin family peptidyl-prolyl cis-trans isomerase
VFSSHAQTDTEKKNPVVVMKTNMGAMEIELYRDKAPITVENFLAYVNEAFYDSTIFHRVIPRFMIQGGGFTVSMMQLATKPPIKNEATNGLSNLRGTISMARRPDKGSATCQFFINHADNTNLDHKDATDQGYGYAVFGKVVKGLDVVDKIAAVKTQNIGSYQNVPVDPVVIESVRLKK